MPSLRSAWLALACLLVSFGAATSATDFVPDPASVQRWGPAYRYPQAGWIVLHIEGEPYERGYQHGRLLAHEIADHVKTRANHTSFKAPAVAWRDARLLVNSLFLRRYEPEYLEEMKGIADGAAAGGAKFEGRAIDFLDVVTLNSYTELDFLNENLEATPTGLESLHFKEPHYARPEPKALSHCSAFAATGLATADGKIVFGHITMGDLYHARHYNVWLDLKPARGHAVAMQSFPGGIMSGLDYYTNSAGLLVCETTIAQTRFNISGTSMVSRIRQAVQYAASVDDFVRIMSKDNNGVYTNEWLLGDTKTNEIAMFELGTFKSRLWRSSQNDWYGDTPGFYWGCNNAKDLQVRLETVPSVAGKPANVVFYPEPRDFAWLKLYAKHRGKIAAGFGFEAFTMAPIAAYHSWDAKFTTADLARQNTSWALFGPPLGRTWEPTESDHTQFPDIRPLVRNDWALLHPQAPLEVKNPSRAVDLASAEDKEGDDKDDLLAPGKLPAAWHGTLLPKDDADVWLATAFADYERIVSLEKALKERAKDGKLSEADRDRIAVARFEPWSRWRTAVARLGKEVSLGQIKRDLQHDEWYDIAAGQGVMLLADLRERMGAEAFDTMMDQFGRAHAGQPVSAAQFRDFVQKASGQPLVSASFECTVKPLASSPWAIHSFVHNPDDMLIVYGTKKESHAQKEAASLLQKKIMQMGTDYVSNRLIPIEADSEVTEADLKGRHLLLIGRPDSNRLLASSARDLPVTFGTGSFVVRGKTYANPGSAVIVATVNPLNPARSVVVFAGLSADATRRCVQHLSDDGHAPVLLLAEGTSPRLLVPPAAEKPATP